ncbi:hypothetical protein FRC07_011449 [Ceratobasidium sp. 392]|nr:hypothetical protein FRC07_011449 [Ceratobasidium sp. 392]
MTTEKDKDHGKEKGIPGAKTRRKTKNQHQRRNLRGKASTPPDVRHFQRERSTPLEWRRGEKSAFGRPPDSEERPLLIPHTRGIKRPPKPSPVPLNKKHRARRAKSVKVKTEGQDEGKSGSVDGNGVFGGPRAVKDGVDEEAEELGVEMGFVTGKEIEQRITYPGAHQVYVFYCVSGAAEVEAHKSTFVITSGGMFLAPRGKPCFPFMRHQPGSSRELQREVYTQMDCSSPLYQTSQKACAQEVKGKNNTFVFKSSNSARPKFKPASTPIDRIFKLFRDCITMTAIVASPPIFFDLTAAQLNPSTPLYFCEYLIRLIGSEVTTFRRNALASYHFVDTAHHVVGELRQLIDETDQGEIESFCKWTEALEPLEKLLLDFDPKDFIGSDKLVEVSAPLACKQDLDQWKNVRVITHKKLQSLLDEDGLKELAAVPKAQDLQDVHRRDDQAFLNDLVSDIELLAIPASPTPPETFKTLFTKVPDQASTIAKLFGQKNIFTSDSEVLVVLQSTMAICGWLHFATQSGEDKDKDITTLKHMWSNEVCSSAQALLEGLIDLGGGPSGEQTQIGPVQELYHTFIDLAFGIPDVSCVDLIKLLSDIGRAYHAQALALIALCDEAVKYNEKQPAKDSQRVKDIGQALDQTSKALTKAAETAKEGVGALGLPQWVTHKEGDDFDKDECSVQFQTAMATIVETFKKIGVATAVQRKEDFATALKKDKELTNKANDRMVAIKTPEKTVKVTVNVLKPDGSSLLDPPHTGGWTLVSAIEWGVSNIPEVKGELTGKFTHFKLDDRIIAKHKSVGELGPTGTLALVMAIADKPMPQANGRTSPGN